MGKVAELLADRELQRTISAICLAINAGITMLAVIRIGRIGEDLLRAISRMQMREPNGLDHPSDRNNALENAESSRDLQPVIDDKTRG